MNEETKQAHIKYLVDLLKSFEDERKSAYLRNDGTLSAIFGGKVYAIKQVLWDLYEVGSMEAERLIGIFD